MTADGEVAFTLGEGAISIPKFLRLVLDDQVAAPMRAAARRTE